MFSATVWADPYKYQAEFGSLVCTAAFQQMLERRSAGEPVCVPMELEQAFLSHDTADLRAIRQLIRNHRNDRLKLIEASIGTLSKRLHDIELTMTVPRRNSVMVRRRTVERELIDARLERKQLMEGVVAHASTRVVPGTWVPLVTFHDGRSIVRPMRLQCRPSRWTSKADRRLAGSHVVARNSLQGIWREHYGHTHGVIALEAFKESLAAHVLEKRRLGPREEITTTEVTHTAADGTALLVPCIWSHWQEDGAPELWSFAVISDSSAADGEPAGGSTTLAVLKKENVAAWLTPQGRPASELEAILDDRPHTRMQFTYAKPRDARWSHEPFSFGRVKRGSQAAQS
ncbi:hypothetical protein GCM10007320_54360 [Pseudorhodoferax aquiterrae]|uniref:SOS response-associated peptidase YedK n=1 Tax=Pseudorhodoferax aquiterrae TaxID=747304 RepID=A0ABQ3GBP2_9BURK|nr:SOS response-associated peptidase family protein [Pseudorhodoferax aquiterrae]PZP90810.1 MAG: hypothetical protein DI583_37535 [Variovorax paradoxus]PZQ00091.1 MAG: hypothetical protein DI587_37535 [Variovorax paradoxus]GHC98506.1 hypothetical protein GCM10007320_54360 [Pseudorhodoferax aquiterrae]